MGVLFLSSMDPSGNEEEPVNGDLFSNYIFSEYFVPQTPFSTGDDIVLRFEITELIDSNYMQCMCRSVHAPNYNLTHGLLFSNRCEHSEWFDETWGINVSIGDYDAEGGRQRFLQMRISNATEKHAGFYDCTFGVRHHEWGAHPIVIWATTGTRLQLSSDTEWPTEIRYEMGTNLLYFGEIDEEAMIEEGFPNVFKCIVTAWQFPSNVSLYLYDEYLHLSGPLSYSWPSYSSLVYMYRFSNVTTKDVGIYRWIVEVGGHVFEKEIEVQITAV